MKRTFKVLSVLCFWLLLLTTAFSAPASGGQEIRILYLNDLHGYVHPHKGPGSQEDYGGVARLATRLKVLRGEKPALLLAAGDMIQGSSWANFSRGKSVIALMNALHFDAMVLGNHEFDFGQDVLKERIQEATFPVLAANVGGFPPVTPYLLRELGGVRIGIIGIVTEETSYTTHPKNVEGLIFYPAAEVTEKYAKELRPKVDLLIVFSHQGVSADIALAERVRGIDLIVGGHTHTKVEKGIKAGTAVVLQAWEHGKALGVADVKVGDGKVTGIESHLDKILVGSGPEDETVAALVAKYEKEAESALQAVIGEATEDLDGSSVRLRETNLGDIVADILQTTASSDAAIINGGGIRAGIRKGPIRVNDVYAALPFDNYIVAVRITGKQIRSLLEYGVSGVEDEEGRFPQVAGIAFTYAPKAPKGSRVREITLSGKPLEDDREYTVATNDFLAAGGDGYKGFGEAAKSAGRHPSVLGPISTDNVVYNDPGRWVRDVVVDYIRQKMRISGPAPGRILETADHESLRE
jgi:5'-nucleotidase/UDP-sugar diphosphatase